MKQRILELDFAKGVLISLMVLFHLSLFTDAYGKLTQIVYAFHMSGFLLISGCLFNANKNLNSFAMSLRGIVVPYLACELIYILGLSFLGQALHSSNRFELNGGAIAEKLFLSPIGTYWYLHTLFFCYIFVYAAERLKKLTGGGKIILAGCVLFLASLLVEGLKWENIMYFMIGYCIGKCGNIRQCVFPSLAAALPAVLIPMCDGGLSRGSLSGLGMTAAILSLLFALYAFPHLPARKAFVWLGRNSLAIVLFSPIFTVAAKLYAGLFRFDPTHVSWAAASTFLVISLCLACALVCDKLKVSTFLMGKPLYTHYKDVRV